MPENHVKHPAVTTPESARASLEVSDLRGQDLRGLQLAGASLAGAVLLGCRLDDMDLRDADFWGANVALASLRRADLRGARLASATFAGADLRGARLAGADLRFCDLAGARIACVDLGRPRTSQAHVLAAARGYPSFADALLYSAPETSRLKAGEALLAVDAALDASRDATSEIAALLSERDWRLVAVGIMAVVRRGRAGESEKRLFELLAPTELGAAAAVALLTVGTKAELIVERRPELLGSPYRNEHRGMSWSKPVSERLANLERWPSPTEQPPPQRG